MSSRTHHTQLSPSEQVLSQISDLHWKEFLACLPADTSEQAVRHRAFLRSRGLCSPTDLLRGILAYAFCLGSFRQLGGWAQSLGVSSNGARSWAKRTRQSAPWLLWIVQALLTKTSVPPKLSLPEEFGGRIHLVDATHVRTWKRSGESLRLHCSYDLFEQRLEQVLLTDHHTGEGLRHFHWQPGDIVVADSGYCRRQAIADQRAAHLDIVVRLHWADTPLRHTDGSPFDLSRWLSDSSQPGCKETTVAIQVHKRLIPLRMIAVRLSEAAAKRAHRRRKEKARANKRTNQALTIQVADWLIVLTSLPAAQWSAQQVLELYRARWQIELLFKRIKQLVRVHRLRSSHLESAQAVLAAMLIGWIVLEQQASAIKAKMAENASASGSSEPLSGLISPWALCALLTQSLRTMLLGSWSWSQLCDVLQRAPTLFWVSPQNRVHQSSEILGHMRRMLAHALG